MIVIAVAGTFGAGKGTLGEIALKKFNCSYVSTSDVVRFECDKRKLERTRDNLRSLANELTSTFGKAVLAELALGYSKPCDLLIVDGIRRPEEIMFLRNAFSENFHAIWVDAEIKLRFERIKDRKRAGEDALSFEEFQNSEEKEKNGSNSQDLLGSKKICDLFLENNSSKEDFENKVLSLFSSFGLKAR